MLNISNKSIYFLSYSYLVIQLSSNMKLTSLNIYIFVSRGLLWQNNILYRTVELILLSFSIPLLMDHYANLSEYVFSLLLI